MSQTEKRLKEFQILLNERNEDKTDESRTFEKLLTFENAGLFYLEFNGSPFDESFRDFLKLLSEAEVAATVTSLTFLSPDVGGNGTREWDFSPLLASDVEFPELTTLFIDPGEPAQHNQPIVAKSYDEEGMIGKLLLKAPKLKSLTTPSAPDSTFFNVGTRPIYYMRIETGYDHQDFILNLSQCSNFPHLRALDFGDYNQRYMENYQSHCAPFEHYRQLFESETFSAMKGVKLRNSILTAEEISTLKAIRKNVSILSIESYSEYRY